MRKRELICKYNRIVDDYNALLGERDSLRAEHEGLQASVGRFAGEVSKLLPLIEENLDRIRENMRGDLICGRWIDACRPDHTATIYKCDAGWQLVLFLNGKQLSRHVILCDSSGMYVSCREGNPRQEVAHSRENGSLAMGCIGLFLRDDNPRFTQCGPQSENE